MTGEYDRWRGREDCGGVKMTGECGRWRGRED